MAGNGIKRRIYDRIVVNGEPLYTLFDTGARNNYVTRRAARRCGLSAQKLRTPVRTALGGQKTIHRRFVILQGTIQRRPLHLEAYLVDDLGKGDEDAPVDLLFGLLAMEKWGIDPDVRRKRVDLRRFTKEFTEFTD